MRPFEGPADAWDRFVRAQAGWTHFHLHGWRQVLERVFGHECLYLECRGEGGVLRGVLPLVRVRSILFGHYIVSMPFLNYGGPLGDEEAVRALAAEAAGRARRDGVKLLELRSRTPLPIDWPVSHRKLTVLVDIPNRDSKALWSSLSANIRNKVRRPQKAGVTVRFGPAEMDPFFGIFAHHMRDLGTPTQSRGFFAAIRDAFPDSVVFGCAYKDDVPIAGGCGFRWADEFEIAWSSALRAHSDLRANYLLHWSFMEQAANAGCSIYNFGRSTPGSGTHDFKKQWGGRDEQLWWYAVSKRESAETPSPDRGAFRWGPYLWKYLPVGLATRIGPRIVRNLP